MVWWAPVPGPSSKSFLAVKFPPGKHCPPLPFQPRLLQEPQLRPPPPAPRPTSLLPLLTPRNFPAPFSSAWKGRKSLSSRPFLPKTALYIPKEELQALLTLRPSLPSSAFRSSTTLFKPAPRIPPALELLDQEPHRNWWRCSENNGALRVTKTQMMDLRGPSFGFW